MDGACRRGTLAFPASRRKARRTRAGGAAASGAMADWSPSMKLSVSSIDKHLVRVEAEGEITMRDFRADGPDPFDTLLGAGWTTHKVVLDFRKVSFVDSSAIGWLMTCRREFERGGGLFVVHSIQPRVRQVLDLLRVGRALPLLIDEP